MDITEANSKSGLNNHLIGKSYKTETNEVLKVDSVMPWSIGADQYEVHAFFEMDESDSLVFHENIDNLYPPRYTLLS